MIPFRGCPGGFGLGDSPLPGLACRAAGHGRRPERAIENGYHDRDRLRSDLRAAPHLEETEVDERANAIAEGVKTRGGEVVGELEKQGKRRLAYEIDDVREGYYFTMNFRSGADEQRELERQLRLNESVLRHIIIRKGE